MVDEAFPRLVAQALDQLTDFVAVFDAAGTVGYANDFACGLVGYRPEEIVGTSITDLVHPDDLTRAVTVMERLADTSIDMPVTPAFYRIRGRDGGWIRVEINATIVESDAGAQLVAFGRYSGDHDLQDRVMDLLTSHAPTEDAIAVVTDFGHWRHEAIDYAVFYLDDDGRPRGHGSEHLLALGGLDDPCTPWAAVAEKGGDLLAPVGDLHSDYAARAKAAGLTHVWGIAVADPLHDTNAVVAYARQHGGAAAEVHGYALDVMARMMGLVLQWRHQVESLRRAALVDPLTGVANRSGFWTELSRLEAEPAGGPLGLLYVDLDGFKAVNDSCGHAVGDRVLAEAARRLNASVRPGDLVARLGGDEFAIVARGLTSDEDASAIADRVVTALGEPYDGGEEAVEVGASVGVAVARTSQLDADLLLEEADVALYRAKRSGRGRWTLGTGT